MSTDEAAAPAQWVGADTNAFTACRIQYPAGSVNLRQPDPGGLRAAVTAIQRARRRIETRPTAGIIDALDACAERWCTPGDSFRERALEFLGRTTGCARTMLSPALTATFDALRGPHLRTLLVHELGGLEALDDGVVLGTTRLCAAGPRLTWLIGGGIVPNAIATPLFAALLCKSAVLVKTPSREPIFGALLAQSLAAVDADIGACVAAGWWAGGTGALDAVAAEAADTVIVTGSDATLAAVRERLTPDTRLIGYGDRVSLLAVGRERLTRPAGLMWTQLAEAIGWYEQLGCLSPHVVYIEEGGDLSPRQAAEELANAMALYESKAPRGPVSAEVAAALQTHRERAEVRAIDAERGGVWAATPRDAAWVVAYDRDSAFARSPGYRFIHVKPVYDLEDVPTLLGQSGLAFQAVGLEVSAARFPTLAAGLAASGISRVSPAAELQTPPVTWPRDTKPVLSPLVTWHALA